MHMLNQQIQRHPLKSKSVIRGIHDYACFSIHKLLEKIIMEMMYIYEKTNTNLMRPHAGSGYLNVS